MHKIHWGPVIVSAAAGLALSALPSNSNASESAKALLTQKSELIGQSITNAASGELMHGLIFLAVIGAIVGLSKLKTNKGQH